MDLIIIIMFSLAFGSFANNLISYYVSSSKFDLIHSTCLCGKKQLKAIQLIPILSFVFQKGKCKECSERISFRYPVVEVISVIIAFAVYQLFGLEIKSIIIFFILYILLIISVIDYYKLIIPNILTLILLGSVIVSLIVDSSQVLPRLFFSFALGSILYGISYLYEKLKNKNILGMGDIKLIFVLSLLFNSIDVIFAIWISSLTGLLIIILQNLKNLSNLKTIKVPFAIYLSIGFTIVLVWNANSDFERLENLLAVIWQMK